MDQTENFRELEIIHNFYGIEVKMGGLIFLLI
jgi:hypothetical protein